MRLKLLCTSSILAMASLPRLKTLKQTANWKKLCMNVQFNTPQAGRSFATCSNVGLPFDSDCEIPRSLQPLGESSKRSVRKDGVRIGGSELDKWPVWRQLRGRGPQGSNPVIFTVNSEDVFHMQSVPNLLAKCSVFCWSFSPILCLDLVRTLLGFSPHNVLQQLNAREWSVWSWVQASWGLQLQESLLKQGERFG